MAIPANPLADLTQVYANTTSPESVSTPSPSTAKTAADVSNLATGDTNISQVSPEGVYNPTQISQTQTDANTQNPSSNLLSGDPLANQSASHAGWTSAQGVDKTNANVYNASQSGDQTPGTSGATYNDTNGAKMQAAQAEVDPRATVSGQLEQLYKNPEQTWASGAIRTAKDTMAARGLGNSSLTGQAIVQASLEAATPIAQANAAVFGQFAIANLNNRQQANLVNAQQAHEANMANLNADQQARLANQQARLNTLLSDTSQQNAAKQFNAQSTNQTDQFFSGLQSDVEKFNSGQANAIAQYNAGATDSFTKFQAQMQDARDKFNVEQRAAIEQSNFSWRRNVTVANTASINQANQTNAQNALNLSNWALAAKWQQFRDEADYAYNSSESAKNRSYGIATAFLSNAFQTSATQQLQGYQTAQSLGSWAANIVANAFKTT